MTSFLLIRITVKYEDIPNDITNEAGEDEFDVIGDYHSIDIDENSNDSE